MARRTVRAEGLTRFITVCLLSGYGWLAVGGDLGWVPVPRAWGGWGNAGAILLFLALTLYSALIGDEGDGRQQGHPEHGTHGQPLPDEPAAPAGDEPPDLQLDD
jgi:hypothetical protein